jgi:hypothetical protein
MVLEEGKGMLIVDALLIYKEAPGAPAVEPVKVAKEERGCFFHLITNQV